MLYHVGNAFMLLEFEASTLGLVNIQDARTGHQYLCPQTGPAKLWQLVWRRGDGSELITDNTMSPGRFTTERSGEDMIAELVWPQVSLGEGGEVSVRVTARLAADAEISYWHIAVENHSQSYGLWEVHFPLLGGIPPAGEVDLAIPRGNWGMRYPGVAEEQTGQYPSYNWPMSFLLQQQGKQGLYLAAHDPRAYPKSFQYQPGRSCRIITMPENMGVAGSGFDNSLPYAIGVYQGDWWVGAKIFRAWALREAPWTQDGPLATRTDVPDSLKRVALWMLASGGPEEVVPPMLEAAKFFDVPLGIHWYNWHQIPFDTDYPDYFPTKPGFAEGVRELRKKDIVVMPYINARLWDQTNEGFEAARPYAAKPCGDEPYYIEEYGSGAKLVPICPYTRFWQDKVNEIVRRLIEECGVNAIYLDQVSSARPRYCFHPAHGHPLGGGSHWVDGYNEMLQRVKAQAAGHVGITSENNADPYMRGVDALLIWNPRHPDEIPLVTAVYSGYTIYFGSPVTNKTGDTSFCMAQGRDFLWGTQIGWMGFDLLQPEHRAKAEYLRTLAHYRVIAHKFLTEGELLGELKPVNEVPRVQGLWNTWQTLDLAAELPAVIGTVWQAQDGHLGLLITNVDEKPHEFSYRLKVPFKGFRAYGLTPSGQQEVLARGGDVWERTELVGPRQVVFGELEPVL